MGAPLNQAAARLGGCLEALGDTGLQLLIGALYVAFLALNVVALVTLVSAQTWPIAFAFVAALASGIGHFTITFLGAALIDNIILYPVYPRVLYLLADMTTGVVLGLVIGGTSVDDRVLPFAANGVLAGVAVLQLYKVYAVLQGFPKRTRL